MSQQDMTPKEARAAMNEMRALTGGKGHWSVDVTEYGPIWSATMWPNGLCAHGDLDIRLHHEGETLRDTVEQLRADLVTYIDSRSTSRTRAMALKIIAITADQGQCTDAALRMTGDFTEAEIATYGEAACKEATSMGANGPFSIVATASNQNEVAA